ncbi:MAG: tetratricopeptide repeat protein [Elusimicrobia bacterium]|nr:tetratricopeptide repeat protein [Elusimicrobiota bacterium]
MRRAAPLGALLLLGACATPPSTPLKAGASAPSSSQAAEKLNLRRGRLLERLGGAGSFSELLRLDDFNGPLLAGESIEAYAEGSELKAVLLSQAALGADPGNGARRRLLKVLEDLTGIPADPEGLLPLDALVQHELSGAEQAFFDRRFGAAIQACRRALLLLPENRSAWLRLGSSYYALGDEARAREAWGRARGLDPADPALARFLAEKGWTQ